MHPLKPWTLSLLVAAATAVVAPAVLAATPAGHDHAAASHAQLTLDHGRPWGTDATLRDGMGRIRGLVADALPDAHAGRLDATQSAALAGRIEQEVANIVANCKLEPQADAMLHLVIAQIAGGVDTLAGKTPDATAPQGLVRIAGAVNDYGRFFDHPGFAPIRMQD